MPGTFSMNMALLSNAKVGSSTLPWASPFCIFAHRSCYEAADYWIRDAEMKALGTLGRIRLRF